LGVVLYVLLCGRPPFPGEQQKEIIENVLSGQFHFEFEPFRYVSENAKDLIKKLLVLNVQKRYSAE
jgi:calcium-dependent protein kinase